MNIVVPIVSILALTGLAWLGGRALRAALCPICIGVAGTWLWMLGARFFGLPMDTTLLAVLLGASVVGIAGQVESRLAQARSPLLWKSLALPIGFIAAYGAAVEQWSLAAAAAAALLPVSAWCLTRRPAAQGDVATIEKLEHQMKNCC